MESYVTSTVESYLWLRYSETRISVKESCPVFYSIFSSFSCSGDALVFTSCRPVL